MKKVKYIILIGIMMLCLTGCGNKLNGAEDVAKKMAQFLIDENYESAVDLIDKKELYINSEILKNYVENEDIDLTGNKKLEVIHEELEENQSNRKVQIKIDNNKIFWVNTTLIDGKWYVDLDEEVEDLKITVPKDAIVKLDNNIVSADYSTKDEIKNRFSYSSADRYTVNFTVITDVYTLKVLPGEYKLDVSGKNINSVSQNIPTNHYNFTDTTNLTYTYENGYLVSYKADEERTEKLKKFYSTFILGLANNIANGKSFSDVKELSDKEGKLNSMKELYNDFADAINELKCKNFTLSKVGEQKNNGVYALGNDRYVVFYSMNANVNTKDGSRTTGIQAMLLVYEESDGKYLVVNAGNFY